LPSSTATASAARCFPGHIAAGAWVPCPDGDHDHLVLGAVHAEVAENIRIIE
jgi:hypothetical protein